MRTILALLVLAATSVAAAQSPLDELKPPATAAEKALFNLIKGDPAEVKLFVATRKFVRAPSQTISETFSYRFLVNAAEESKFLPLAGTKPGKKVDCASIPEREVCAATQQWLRENYKPGADPNAAAPLPKGADTKYVQTVDEKRFIMKVSISQTFR